MSRRRSFPSEGPRSNSPRQSQRPRPGSKPRTRRIEVPGRDKSGLPRHGAGAKPRSFNEGGGHETDKPDRLQKVLAHAGLGSRRGCEELILQGRVSINGEVIRQLGTRVDPTSVRITVDGEPIKLEAMVYYAVNKPKGYVSTNSDPSGRPRVVDLLPEIPERVYTVGRLDEASTGLLILTNDGDLANRLAHPRYGVEKLYRALVAGLPTPEMMAKLTEGVWLSDGKVRAKRARIVNRQGQATMLELVLAEGKKREIRRMLSKLGHKVMSLNRIAVGPISLKGLSVGECRSLSRHEIELLRQAASGASVAPARFSDADSNRPPSRAESGRKRPATLPPRAKPRNKTNKPVESPRTRASTALPPEPLEPRRRIIGLELDSGQRNRPSVAAGGSRKRPPVRKRRPPGPIPGKKRNLSAQNINRDDEDG
jgi:23S rRNA pseudouridine2605 synthase